MRIGFAGIALCLLLATACRHTSQAPAVVPPPPAQEPAAGTDAPPRMTPEQEREAMANLRPVAIPEPDTGSSEDEIFAREIARIEAAQREQAARQRADEAEQAARQRAAAEAERAARAAAEREARAAQQARQPEPTGAVPPPPPPPPPPATGATPPPIAAQPAIDPDKNYALMRVFYATDRAAAANFAQAPPAERYGTARGRLEYGLAEVSIPREHSPGVLEAPSIWRLEFREDPSLHVVLMAVQRRTGPVFFRELSERVKRSEGGNAFLFVHGYNVSFADAARRTAQMSYDLAFDGAAVFYSWPSQASLPGYTIDESNIEWSTAHIKQFLVDFAEKSQARNLYLIAHSMGNRGLTRALQMLMLERPDLRGRFREIILAAPDVDAEVFRRDLVPALRQAGQRVTLYASSNDLALQASKQVHGYARAGDSGDGLVVVPGLETIDASGVDESVLAHSYFVESKPVIRDILDLLRHSLPAGRRQGLVGERGQRGAFWRFRAAPPAE